jgi:hypothetical protein
MSEQVLVRVSVDSPPVPALVLKWDSQRLKALVTYESDGHVQTQWLTAEQVVLPEA